MSVFGKVLLLHLSAGPWSFQHESSEGQVDKRRDKDSLTEAWEINLVQAGGEMETVLEKDIKMSPSIGLRNELTANLHCLVHTILKEGNLSNLPHQCFTDKQTHLDALFIDVKTELITCPGTKKFPGLQDRCLPSRQNKHATSSV